MTRQTFFKRLTLKATKPAPLALKIFEKVSVKADSTNFFRNADIATYTAWQTVKLNDIFIVINRATFNALIIFIKNLFLRLIKRKTLRRVLLLVTKVFLYISY